MRAATFHVKQNEYRFNRVRAFETLCWVFSACNFSSPLVRWTARVAMHCGDHKPGRPFVRDSEDIKPNYGGYWQYGLPREMSEEQVWQKKIPLVYKNRIPIEIVKAFVKHGFIWGGNWHHFDGMHFEHRSEFLALKTIMGQ